MVESCSLSAFGWFFASIGLLRRKRWGLLTYLGISVFFPAAALCTRPETFNEGIALLIVHVPINAIYFRKRWGEMNWEPFVS